MIVDARGGDVGVTEPFLHFGDVGLVVERISGRGGPQRMRANLKSEGSRIGTDQLVNAIRCDCLIQIAGAVVADRSE